MQPSEKEAIKLLRSQIPIGVSEAVALLNTHAFDVNLAVADWKKKTIQIFSSKNSVTDEEASNLLATNSWMQENALQTLKERRLTLTDRVLQSSNDNHTILHRISILIDEANPFLVQDMGFISMESLAKLPSYQDKFHMLWYWLGYGDYEGFDAVINVEYIQKIISFLYEIELENYADAIVNALESKRIFYEKYQVKEGSNQYVRVNNILRNDPSFAKYDELFRLNQESIYKRLVAFVKEHKEHFPK